jgi:DtxR family Mn-dependent transcriptional regulator
MGHIAQALGVTPGSATTMVKALAESGLVVYEPYSGVRLSSAGERLAALVLRRHRLVELFLVQVMGMNWDEVHDEAEKLEHVVSERLIERIDAMLGRPEVDPHGDPIPDAAGSIRQRQLQTLLTCPLNTPVTVTRVVDQDAEFLRFIESHDLKPGQAVEVESRSAMADSVSLRGKDDRRTTIGTRAASKLLVDIASVLLLACAVLTGVARAQTAEPPAAAPPSRFGTSDNSFYVEEAFNQEPGIVQNIFGFERMGPRGWNASFTQEWPAAGIRHQLSYTLTGARDGGSTRFSDAAIHYRHQVWNDEGRTPAFSPRVSLLVTRNDGDTPADEGMVGLQTNLPFSKDAGWVFLHANAGLTWLPSASTAGFQTGGVRAAEDVALLSPFFAGSVIVAARPMFNLMFETVVESEESVVGPGLSDRSAVVTFAPGARGGWNIGDAQLILGLAVPFIRQEGETDVGLFTYFSYELPFAR